MTQSKHSYSSTHTKDRDHFFDDCFSFAISNEHEKRNWSRIDEFKGVPDLVKKEDYNKAWFILDHVSAQYTDYNFIYAWKATILQKKKDYNAARDILIKGIKNAKSTHLLCERMGYLEFESGDINDAVMWWIRSVVLMNQPNATKRWEGLLYLSYIAKACGWKSNHEILMTIVSRISIHGRLELESETIALLEKKVPELETKPIEKAIGHLCVYYLKDQIQLTPNINKEIEKTNDPAHPSAIRPNPINSNKTVLYYLGFGIFFVSLILFSFYYINSDRPINRSADKPLVNSPANSPAKSNIDMEISTEIKESNQDVPTKTMIIEDNLSFPDSGTEMITAQKKIDSEEVQIPKLPDIIQPDVVQLKKSNPDKSETNQTQVAKVVQIVPNPEKINAAPPKDTNKTSPIIETTPLPVIHKKKSLGLKIKNKSPKPVRIQKEKTDD